MNENKTIKAIMDMELSISLFYNEMKAILASKRGKRYQYMMLDRTFEAIMCRCSQVRKKHDCQPELKSPLDI